MIENCKICGKRIPTPSLGEDYWCYHCTKYSLVYDKELDSVESETIRVGNYTLHFFPMYKEASVVEASDDNHHLLHKFSMEELTHDVALHWVDKLKKYVVFQ